MHVLTASERNDIVLKTLDSEQECKSDSGELLNLILLSKGFAIAFGVECAKYGLGCIL